MSIKLHKLYLFMRDPVVMHANMVQQIFRAQDAWGMAENAYRAIMGDE